MFIYIRCGHTIYLKQKELHNFSSTDQGELTTIGEQITTIKTTEVSVTSEVVGQESGLQMQPISSRAADVNDAHNPNYSVTISADTSSGDIGDMVHPIEPVTTTIPLPTAQQQARRDPAKRRRREFNSAAMSYAKCALLFFTAILITWIPSSANRVYSVLHTKTSSVPLEFMSAFVLPLQGFWNAIIYMVTSWAAVKNLASDLRLGRRPDVTELVGGMTHEGSGTHHHHHHHHHHLASFRTATRTNKTYETESMTELANSRPNSDDGRHGVM